MRKRVGRGLIAILAASTGSLIFGTLGWSIIGLFAGVGVGILLGCWAGEDSSVAFGVGALFVPCTALFVLMQVDIAVLGGDRGTIALDELGRGFGARLVRFSDAHVAADHSASAAVSSRGGTTSTGRWFVAPIVPKDWTAAQPVRAWAVARTSVYGSTGVYGPEHWRQDYRGGVFFKPSVFDEVSEARESVIRRYRLSASGHEPMLYWVADPRAVLAQECVLALEIMFGACGLWILVVLGEAVIHQQPAAA